MRVSRQRSDGDLRVRGGTGVTRVSRDLYTFLLRVGSTRRGWEGGPLPCFVLPCIDGHASALSNLN